MNYANLASALGIRGIIRGDELSARCPLHRDNNPSFSLNINKGVWICFSHCGGGDFVELVQRVLASSIQEARDWIDSNGTPIAFEQANRALLAMLERPQPEEKEIENLDWLGQFHHFGNTVIPMWFLNRGFTWDTVNHWNIRYNPITDAVIIPVYWGGKLLGTVTRNTFKSLPKYQNSPNLPRSQIFFGEISTRLNEIIICEGVLDALWFWQNGFHAVSLLGSFLSQRQTEILKEHGMVHIVLALDNDEAGRKGTDQAKELLLKSGWLLQQISILKFPPGKKDAQDCSPEELNELYARMERIALI